VLSPLACIYLGFGIVDCSLMAVQNLGPTVITRLNQLVSFTCSWSLTLVENSSPDRLDSRHMDV